MDIGSFNRAERAQAGSWMHVLHPETREPLFLQAGDKPTLGEAETDRPCRVLVQGVNSPALRKIARAHADDLRKLQSKMQRANSTAEYTGLQKQVAELQEAHGLRLINEAVIGWENFPYNGELLDFTAAHKNLIFPIVMEEDCATEWLIEDVANFSRDPANFFTKPVTA